MISANDDDMAAGGGYPAEKAVVEFLGAVARGGGIENIAGHQQNVRFFSFNVPGQPVQKGRKFIVSTALIEVAAEVPVGCVQ